VYLEIRIRRQEDEEIPDSKVLLLHKIKQQQQQKLRNKRTTKSHLIHIAVVDLSRERDSPCCCCCRRRSNGKPTSETNDDHIRQMEIAASMQLMLADKIA